MPPKAKIAAGSCQECSRNDSFEDMVCCGKCKKWSHYSCAGVGPKIRSVSWKCHRCIARPFTRQSKMKNEVVTLDLILLHFNFVVHVRLVQVKKMPHIACHSKEIKKSAIPLIKERNAVIKKTNVTASEIKQVQEEIKNLNEKQDGTRIAIDELTKEFKNTRATDLDEVRETVATVALEQVKSKLTLAEFNVNLARMSDAIKKSTVESALLAAFHSREAQGAAAEFATVIGMSTIENAKPKESEPSYNMSMLPVESLIELDKLLVYVKTDSGFLKYQSYISSYCGNDAKSSIRVVLNQTMTKSVQSKLSWSGIGTNKPSLEKKYKRIVDAMNEVFQKKHEGCNYDILKSKLSTLLQNAKE